MNHKNLLMSLLCMVVICELAYGSALRVNSMGGVSICVRDDENDPIAINPARTVLIKQSKITAQINRYNYLYNYDERREYPGTPPTGANNSYSSSRTNDSSLGLNILGYLKLKDTLGMGIEANSDTNNSDTFSRSLDVGKWEFPPVYISTSTYEYKSEGASEYSPAYIQLLGGYKLNALSIGLSLKMTPLYKFIDSDRYTEIDNEYNVSYSTTQVDSMKTEINNLSNNIRIGGLLHFNNTSMDITIGLTNSDSEYRLVEYVFNNADLWKDDKDLYPIIKTKESQIDMRVLINQKISEKFILGTDIRYQPTDSVITEERSDYTYDSTKSKKQYISVGLGVGLKPEESLIGGIELMYSMNNTDATDFDWDGNKAVESITRKITDYSLVVKLGIEKYLIEDIFALRLGGTVRISSDNSNEFQILSTNYTSRDVYSRGGTSDSFNAGFCYKLTDKIIFEYGLSNLGNTHQLLAKLLL